MTRLDGKPVLTAAELREAEARAMRRDVTEDDLIARAGAAVADWVRRLAVGAETLVLCGPGNNGADGNVAAA
jgi:NAD(P)H-hydrate repair Nnr-like enzyme with NAD(P)H-hydrate epimerase domain